MAPRSDRRGLGGAELIALLGALSFFLSAVEYSLPKPLPFVRLGIANLPLLLAVDLLPLPSLLVLAIVKFAGMGLVSGTLFSYIAVFSATGTLASTLAMWLARRLGGSAVSHLGISVAGAMASSAGQVLLAGVFVFGPAAWFVAPVILASSLATGSLLGIFATSFAAGSAWYAWRRGAGPRPESAGLAAMAEAIPAIDPRAAPRRQGAAAPARAEAAAKARSAAAERARRRAEAWDGFFAPAPLALAGAAFSIALLFQRSLIAKALELLVLAILVPLSGRRASPLAALGVTLAVVLANLAIPVGRVLFHAGPLVVTETALLEGLSKAIALQGLLLASKLSIRRGLRFPGTLGELISRAFLGYQAILESGWRPRPRELVADADRLFMALETERLSRAGTGEAPSPTARGTGSRRSLALLALAAAIPLALALLPPAA